MMRSSTLCRTVNGVVSVLQKKAAPRCKPSFSVTTCVTQRSCSSIRKSDDGSIGFIGLGSMGYPMALNILMNYGNASIFSGSGSGSGSTKKIPRKVYLYDVDHEKAMELIKEFSASSQAGSLETVEAESVSDLSFNCSTIITMLPNTSHVFDIMTRTEGVFNSAKKGITLRSTYYILHITYYILHITYYILHITYYILHITYYILHQCVIYWRLSIINSAIK